MKINKNNVKLIRIDRIPNSKNNIYVCTCPLCGEEIKMWSSCFYRGSNSCKCKNEAVGYERIYSAWINMKTRCYNKNSIQFSDYGGRGILISEEWRFNFKEFKDWSIKNGYAEKLTIDRIDNSRGYSSENCRWVDMYQQARNKRSNINFEINGLSKCMKEWCIITDCNYKAMYSHYMRYGYESTKLKLINRLKEEYNGMES